MEFDQPPQDAVLEAKKQARAKLEAKLKQAEPTETPAAVQEPLPPQYPNKINLKQELTNLVNKLATVAVDNDSGSETDDDCFRMITMTKTRVDFAEPPPPDDDNHIEIQVNSDLITMSMQSISDDTVWAFSDGCADSCVAGKGVKVLLVVTGCTASPQECDPPILQSGKLPIVTCAIKLLGFLWSASSMRHLTMRVVPCSSVLNTKSVSMDSSWILFLNITSSHLV